jgi:pimeloyl-ACP methyl ester carboxylesterase
MTASPAHGPRAEPWFVEEHGTPGGATHVLVHGIGVSARYLRRLARELAPEAHVLVPELPGFGRTPRLDHAPSVQELADGLAAARAVLTGHSMGAQVVAETARRHPDLAERVVLLGPVVDPAAPSALAQGLRLARDTLREPLGGNAIVLSDYLRTGPVWYARQLPHMLGYRTRDAVAQLSCPVLVVRGVRDPVAPQQWVTDLAATAARGHAVAVPGAAHLVQHVRPREVAALCLTGAPVVGDDLSRGEPA